MDRLSCDWPDRNTLSHIQVTLPVPQHVSSLKRLTAASLTPPASCLPSERERGDRTSSSHQQRSGGRRFRGERGGRAALPPAGQELNAAVESMSALKLILLYIAP